MSERERSGPAEPQNKSGHTSGGADTTPRPEIFCGDIDIRIAADGTWFHEGSPIGRKELVRLFASVLSRDADGDYWLITPVERARIKVDDAPFVAVEMSVAGQGRDQVLTFRTNIDDTVAAGAAHPIAFRLRPGAEHSAPYLQVRDGLEALIARSVYYDLVALGVERRVDGKALFGVWSGGRFFAFADAAALP
jgi:hypothetical protein